MLINRNDVPAVLQPALDFEVQRLGLDIYVNTKSTAPDDATVGNTIELWWPRHGDTQDVAIHLDKRVIRYTGPWHPVHGDHMRRADLDEDGYGPILAGVRDRQVLLAFDPARLLTTSWADHEGNSLPGNPLGRLFGDVLSHCLPHAAEQSACHHHWVAAKMTAIDDRIVRTRSDLRENEHRLFNIERELLAVAKKAADQRQLLEILDGEVKAQRKRRARQEVQDAGRLIPHAFERIAVGGNGESVVARTTPVHIAHNDATIDFGRFDVVIHLRSGTITALAVEPNVRRGYAHPHLDEEGNPCWGNMSRPIKEALAAGHVVEALSTVRAFLSSYNPDNPYVTIDRWLDDDVEEETERFERCYETADAFGDCITCADSDCPYWHDRHDRCWETANWASLRDCVGCGRCEHAAEIVDDCRGDHDDGEGCVSCRANGCEHQGRGPDDDNDDSDSLVQIGR